MRKASSISVLACLRLALLAFFFALLAWVYLSGGKHATGLASLVAANQLPSGVESRVTAVLLNIRAYDTLLECFVLLLGVVVVWSLRPSGGSKRPQEPGPVLQSLLTLLLPLMVLVAGYLLWAGAMQAGGAFQAGAIVGGLGVLLALTKPRFVPALPRPSLLIGICLGPFVFLLVGLLGLAMDSSFLHYRHDKAALAVAVLEITAALSIGLSLAALFAGRSPDERQQYLTAEERKP